MAIIALQHVSADVVYSTIDPNATTYTFPSGNSAYAVLNHPPASPVGAYQSYADEFSPTATFTLASISFAVRTIDNFSGALNAVVYPNNPATNLPLVTAPLASSSSIAPAGGTDGVQTVDLTTFDFSVDQLIFLTGQTYWIALEPGGDGTDVEWGIGDPKGSVAENLGSGYHQYLIGDTYAPTLGAFDINTVPEPSAPILLLGGIATTLLFPRSRRNGWKHADVPTGLSDQS